MTTETIEIKAHEFKHCARCANKYRAGEGMGKYCSRNCMEGAALGSKSIYTAPR